MTIKTELIETLNAGWRHQLHSQANLGVQLVASRNMFKVVSHMNAPPQSRTCEYSPHTIQSRLVSTVHIQYRVDL